MGDDRGFLAEALHHPRWVGLLTHLRDARAYRVSPVTYLGLPWPQWGETARLLAQAVAEHDRRICSCGCGQWSADALDPDHLWVVEKARCTAGEALAEASRSFGEEGPPAGTLLRVRDGGKTAAVNPFADQVPIWSEVGAPPTSPPPQHPPGEEGLGA